MSHPQAPPSPPLMGVLAHWDSQKKILGHKAVQIYRNLQEDNTKWHALPNSAQAGLPLKRAWMSPHIGYSKSKYLGKDQEGLDFFDLAFNLQHEQRDVQTGVIIARCDEEDLLPEHFDLYCHFLHERCFALRPAGSLPMVNWQELADSLEREYLNPTTFFKYFQHVREKGLARRNNVYHSLSCPVELPPPVPICANCGGSTGLAPVLCQRCLTTAYCGQACMSRDAEKHSESCGQPNLTVRIPCVYAQIGWTPDPDIGRQDTWIDCAEYTPSNYPGHLLVHPNVIESKASAILGTPLWIIQSPIDVPAGSYATIEQKRVYKAATLLTMEMDLQKANFSWPTKRIFSDVAIVRRDGRELDWRLVEYMVSWLWEIHETVYKHKTVVKEVPSDQTANKMLNAGMFRDMFGPWQKKMKDNGHYHPKLYEPIDPAKFW